MSAMIGKFDRIEKHIAFTYVVMFPIKFLIQFKFSVIFIY